MDSKLQVDEQLIRACENLLHAAEAAGHVARTHHHYGSIAGYRAAAKEGNEANFRKYEGWLRLWLFRGTEEFMPESWKSAIRDLMDKVVSGSTP